MSTDAETLPVPQIRTKAHIAVKAWLVAEFGPSDHYDEMIMHTMKLIRAALKMGRHKVSGC